MEQKDLIPQDWIEKVSNVAQLGGIETSILDNGLGKGNRIAWVNTGSGLRFKVVLDRAMDIAEAFFNEHSLAWLSHSGFTTPQPLSDKGIDWLKTFGGGLLTTCGLSHVGGPESDAYGERGIHGNISNIPAEMESITQPDLHRGNREMSLSGTMKETKVFGPNLELKRTISCTLGESKIRIHDEVINKGNTPTPLMVLYHLNFGYPLLDENTEIIWEGDWQPRFADKAKIFKEGNNFKSCPTPLAEHSGSGEEVALIDPFADTDGNCVCGLKNQKLGILVEIKFKKEQLPKLTNWQHWGKGEYVTGLEPGTNWPIGQHAAREQNELLFLQPNEIRKFDIELIVKNLN